MVEDNTHHVAVGAWVDRLGATTPRTIIEAFERMFAALWGRARETLGEVTLAAILDRVVYVATERYPSFSVLSVDATGLRCDELRRGAELLNLDELTDSLRFVMSEFLTVLGNLTAEILTPALHAVLSSGIGEDEKS